MTNIGKTPALPLQDRMAQLEYAVWNEVAHREKKTQRMTGAFAVLAFCAVSAGSYSVGSLQAERIDQHVSMAAELSQAGDMWSGQTG